MAAFPVEVLLGIYLGTLTGIIPAVVAWGLGFIFKYFTGISIPALAVVVLSLALAGANGGLLALTDPSVTGAPNQVTLTTAIIVVLMISLYAHSMGDRTGATLPRHLSFRRLRERTLSSDVVELVGGLGRVRVSIAGDVADLEGYPPLPEDVRATIREGTWTFPADLPLSELERRLADALRTSHDLADVSVSIDEHGEATVAAAPPVGGLSKRVPGGRRAVSIRALVPTGLARGDEVTVHLEDAVVRGTVVSARSDLPGTGNAAPNAPEVATEVDGEGEGEGEGEDEGGGGDTAPVPVARSPTTAGGDGRLTLAVTREDAERLLGVDRAHMVVRARGTRREFELLSLLRRAGKRFRKVTVGAGSEITDTTIGGAAVRERYGVVVLAIRHGGEWTLAPRGSAPVGPGDELYVVGTGESVARFAEAAA